MRGDLSHMGLFRGFFVILKFYLFIVAEMAPLLMRKAHFLGFSQESLQSDQATLKWLSNG